jgi:hypothetical protein
MRRWRGCSSGGVDVGRRRAAGDGLREASPAVYDGVEERLLLAAGEARRGGGDLGPRRPRKRRPRHPRRPTIYVQGRGTQGRGRTRTGETHRTGAAASSH